MRGWWTQPIHQQTDVIIGFLFIASCASMMSGAIVAGAAIIGLAAACKGPPLLFAAHVVFRRRWVAGGFLGVLAFGDAAPRFRALPKSTR